MQSSQIPYKFQEIWAAAAGVGYINSPIPDTSTGANASQHLGFPPITATPIGSGGIPPIIGDFNGAFQYVTQWLQWVQAGGPIRYDSTFSGNIGGYPNGTILGSTSQGVLWQSTADNNTTNPDGGSPANWISLTSGKLINIRSFLTHGTSTYTPTTGTSFIIVQVLGAGGGSGGSSGTTSSQTSCTGGGGSGANAMSRLTSGFSGVNIIVGQGGGAGTVGSNGGNGGTSSFGALISAPGGFGSSGQAAFSTVLITGGGSGASLATGGNIYNAKGAHGGYGFGNGANGGTSGAGADSPFGGGAEPQTISAGGPSATTPGTGAGGAMSPPGASAAGGGNGADGAVIIWEFSS